MSVIKKLPKGCSKEFKLGYNESLKFTEMCYNNKSNDGFIDGHNIYSYSTMLIVSLTLNEKLCSQILNKEIPNENNTITLSRGTDILSAIYVPEDFTWVKVLFENPSGDIVIDIDSKRPRVPLPDLLFQTQQLPKTRDNLADLLRDSRKSKININIHRQQEELFLEGQRYIRIIPLQPFIPQVCFCYTPISLQFDGNYPVYFEYNSLRTEERRVLTQSDLCFYDPYSKRKFSRYHGQLVEID